MFSLQTCIIIHGQHNCERLHPPEPRMTDVKSNPSLGRKILTGKHSNGLLSFHLHRFQINPWNEITSFLQLQRNPAVFKLQEVPCEFRRSDAFLRLFLLRINLQFVLLRAFLFSQDFFGAVGLELLEVVVPDCHVVCLNQIPVFAVSQEPVTVGIAVGQQLSEVASYVTILASRKLCSHPVPF